MTRVNLPFCHKILTVVRNGGLTALVIVFDMALSENELGPKKIDRNNDLTAMVIWPEGESLLQLMQQTWTWANVAIKQHWFNVDCQPAMPVYRFAIINDVFGFMIKFVLAI